MEPLTYTTTNRTYCNPLSPTLQKELGLTARQIVLRAKRMGLHTRKIYGNIWVADDEAHLLKQYQPMTKPPKHLHANWDMAPAWAKWHTVDMHGCTWWQKRPIWDGWHWGRPFSRDEISRHDDSDLYDDRFTIDDRAEARKTLEKRP